MTLVVAFLLVGVLLALLGLFAAVLLALRQIARLVDTAVLLVAETEREARLARTATVALHDAMHRAGLVPQRRETLNDS